MKLVDLCKKLLKLLMSVLPVKLPQGMTSFDKLVDDLQSTFALPTQKRSDIQHVVASAIINTNPSTVYKSRMYFGNLIKNAGAKQIAGEVFNALQRARKAQFEAEQKAALEAVKNGPETKAV